VAGSAGRRRHGTHSLCGHPELELSLLVGKSIPGRVDVQFTILWRY
jgi:hypothetical protein